MPALLQEVKCHYRAHKRSHLPWRHTKDPYRILVSEVMLQQTQVARVLPFYEAFIHTFPTAQALARAHLHEVLQAWQGLGYNRRAKYLHEAAKQIAAEGFPRSTAWIERLPGVGPYTARAVAAFAFGARETFIETNIRTVFLHFFFPHQTSVSDGEMLPFLFQALAQSRMRPCDFYWALMDYGAYLKRQGVRRNAQSAHYKKQSKFEGSRRQLRGFIIRESLKGPVTLGRFIKKISPARSKGEILRELFRLQKEGLVSVEGRGA